MSCQLIETLDTVYSHPVTEKSLPSPQKSTIYSIIIKKWKTNINISAVKISFHECQLIFSIIYDSTAEKMLTHICPSVIHSETLKIVSFCEKCCPKYFHESIREQLYITGKRGGSHEKSLKKSVKKKEKYKGSGLIFFYN